MSSTQSTTSDDGVTITSLADAIKTDEPEDTRSCRHQDCHGTLTVTDEDRVVCGSCRCTPDGVFLPPESSGGSGFRRYNPRFARRTTWCGDGYADSDPKGVPDEDGVLQRWNHEKYDNSDKARLAGGYDDVYDEEEAERPAGVGDEYTFNLTTL